MARGARGAWYWEFSSSIAGVAWSLDSGRFTLDGSCANCAGQPLTLATTNDAVVQVYSANNPTTGIRAYSNFTTNANRGGADLINTASGAAPAWTNALTANVVVGAVAISEGPVTAGDGCYPGNESGCPTVCPNTGSLASMANTSPAIDCVRGVPYSNLSAPDQALTFDLYTPHNVDPRVPPIIFWCGGAYSGCIDNGSMNICLGGTTASCVLMAEAAGRPVYVVNITQSARCWLQTTVSSGTSMPVSCFQAPSAPFSFWIDYQTGNAEHLTCTNCGNGSPVTWTLSGSTPITKPHTGNTTLGDGIALILPDPVAPPRAQQDSDCFGKWFGTHGGTPTYPGNPLNMLGWSFSSGSTMLAMLMPSAAGAFPSSCDSSGTYKLGASFMTATPVDLAASYQNGSAATSVRGIEEYLGCRPTSGSACATYSQTFSPIYYVGPGNPAITMMSGAVGDDLTIPPLYNEIPYQADYAAIGVTIPWIPLTGNPDYHNMDCNSTPIWTTNCLQQAIKFFQSVAMSAPASPPAEVGVFRSAGGLGTFAVNLNQTTYNYAPGTTQTWFFGLPGDQPVAGDWLGTGVVSIGVFRNGAWYFDLNNNGQFDANEGPFFFGLPGDAAIVGDWTGSGSSKAGVFRCPAAGAGVCTWYLSTAIQTAATLSPNANLYSPATTLVYSYGLPGDQPVANNWSGASNVDQIGVFRCPSPAVGVCSWIVDNVGDGNYRTTDPVYSFGLTGDIAVVGDWNGNPQRKSIGVFRSGLWILDINGSNTYAPNDIQASFGLPGDKPVIGTWTLP